MHAPEINYFNILAIKCDLGALKSCLSRHELMVVQRGGSEINFFYSLCFHNYLWNNELFL